MALNYVHVMQANFKAESAGSNTSLMYGMKCISSLEDYIEDGFPSGYGRGQFSSIHLMLSTIRLMYIVNLYLTYYAQVLCIIKIRRIAVWTGIVAWTRMETI
jgi:hypothetical protein